MERIAVIGCAGSGKTTLARDLGARLGIDVVHLDRLYYGPDWNTPPPAEWEAVQRRLVAEERWIVDGTYASTLPIRLAAADTVVFLDLPTHVCLWSIARRRLRFRGRSRPDLGVYDGISLEFLRFVWSFRRTRRPQVLALIDTHARPGATIVRLRRRRDAQAVVRGSPCSSTPTTPRGSRRRDPRSCSSAGTAAGRTREPATHGSRPRRLCEALVTHLAPVGSLRRPTGRR